MGFGFLFSPVLYIFADFKSAIFAPNRHSDLEMNRSSEIVFIAMAILGKILEVIIMLRKLNKYLRPDQIRFQ